jgi:hypothetical protein
MPALERAKNVVNVPIIANVLKVRGPNKTTGYTAQSKGFWAAPKIGFRLMILGNSDPRSSG